MPSGLRGRLAPRTQRSRKARWPLGHLLSSDHYFHYFGMLRAYGAALRPELNDRAKRDGLSGISPPITTFTTSGCSAACRAALRPELNDRAKRDGLSGISPAITTFTTSGCSAACRAALRPELTDRAKRDRLSGISPHLPCRDPLSRASLRERSDYSTGQLG
jgi:hypothetical protein